MRLLTCSPNLSVRVFGLQSVGLDDVDSHQTVLDAIWRKLLELSGGGGSCGVIRQGVDLEHTLERRFQFIKKLQRVFKVKTLQVKSQRSMTFDQNVLAVCFCVSQKKNL